MQEKSHGVWFTDEGVIDLGTCFGSSLLDVLRKDKLDARKSSAGALEVDYKVEDIEFYLLLVNPGKKIGLCGC